MPNKMKRCMSYASQRSPMEMEGLSGVGIKNQKPKDREAEGGKRNKQGSVCETSNSHYHQLSCRHD